MADRYVQEKRELAVAGCVALLILVAVGNFLYFVHIQHSAAPPFTSARIPMGHPLQATPH